MTTPAYVSIVIATRNRRPLLAQTLEALARQTWPRDRFEIVVADNGSTDGTPALLDAALAAAGGPTLRVLRVPDPGKSFAVNAALRVARGDVLAFTDDDVRPDPRWVERLCEAIAGGADFVAGRILPIWESPPPRWMSRSLYGVLGIPDNGDEPVSITPDEHRVVPIGANLAVRADVVAEVGGLRTDLGKLDGTLRTGEDHEFFLRMLDAGFRGRYEPRAIVHHWVPAARLSRAYCRRWLHQNGRDVARLESRRSARAVHLLGIPRYLWREAIGHGAALVRAAAINDSAARFAADVRLWWMAGYLREAWFGGAHAAVHAAPPAVPIRTPSPYPMTARDRAAASPGAHR